MNNKAINGWCIIEIMGHRRLAGIVSEEQIAGCAFVRIDVPADEDEGAATQFYAPAAVYCITPTTEAIAREFARTYRPAPVNRWELKALPEVARDEADDRHWTTFGDEQEDDECD